MRLLCLLLFVATANFGAVYPGASWERATPAEAGLDETRLRQARDYALSAGGSGYVIRGGKLVYDWGDTRQLYDLKSTTKSIGVTTLGLALLDGKVRLDDRAGQHHPTFGVPPDANREKGWLEKITLRHLANQTAGFAKPGGFQPLLFEPGTKWHYSDSGPNWLAECLTLVYQRDLNDLLFERVFTPLGITPEDLRWRQNQYRPHQINGLGRREFGAGFHANVNAMARIGYFYLRNGQWQNTQIIPANFVELVGRPARELSGLPEHTNDHGNASEHYSLLWWNNGDGTIPDVPRDAFWSWGLYDSLIVVIPSLDLVVSRAGRSWPRTTKEHYDPLQPFLQPLAAAVVPAKRGEASLAPPYPPSRVIHSIAWAPTNEIIRLARGSDNWPVTRTADDSLIGAYGDGRGFEPFVPKKLSLGFARIDGVPPTITGRNIPSTPEFLGDGARGVKASGLLMVDGTLYMWTRNQGPAQLRVSTNRAASWTQTGCAFEQSFGCPTFLNFGPNYQGARDDFVYIYSLDSASAYEPADRMVLARVPKAKVADRSAYSFFVSLDDAGTPQWSADIARRGAIFSFPGHCYRSGVTYNAALKRYLWCQVLPQSKHPEGPRFQGGFGVYDAPEPWGPWTTVFFTTAWDTGPGETSSFPTKWMSPDGRTLRLLFSGGDYLSVREATLTLRAPN